MNYRQFTKKVVSKKFFAFLFVVIVTSLLVVFNRLDADSYQAILMMVTPLYFASDVTADAVRNNTFAAVSTNYSNEDAGIPVKTDPIVSDGGSL